MERAISDLKPEQEQMVWLIDFQGWNMSSVSMKVTRETAHLLQERYPERLGLAILYDPPKVFESFWLVGYLYPFCYRYDMLVIVGSCLCFVLLNLVTGNSMAISCLLQTDLYLMYF